ncbi:hypothetical protein GTP91_07275 [Rugamonas sp. FT82W]|uniref:Uncharacterized protein n=1 Tax=Duganella vulcania TaxID=2692166 RepID=A0A845G1Y8_9BURK|nr:hypothetical protein [Duganella vulcania]MYM86986.1 hypothetical protein [Duganella vulcania]
MKRLLAVLMLAGCAVAVAAAPKTKTKAKPKAGRDPVAEMEEQRKVIADSLNRGDSRERACDIVAQQFSLWCAVRGRDFIVIRGVDTKITYFATLRIPGK